MDERSHTGAAPRRRVLVEFEAQDEQPHGSVETGDGTWRPFWGWLELMQSIEDVLAADAGGSSAVGSRDE